MHKTILGILTATILVFVFSQQVYAETTIQPFNMTEHLANKPIINDDDYCYTSACLLEKANEMMDEAETQAYWNDVNAQHALDDLDRAVEELEHNYYLSLN